VRPSRPRIRLNIVQTVLVDRPTAEQSELSTLEMRLNALPFTEKILRLKPKVVCFVGKKIWDVYESVISRSAVMSVSVSVSVSGAGPSRTSSGTSSSSRTQTTVKMEVEQNTTPIKTEPASNVVEETAPARVGPSTRPVARSTNPRGKREKVEIPKFDWTEPRSFRLPHTQEGRPTRYTYFWVVPNTSGLERTPVNSYPTLCMAVHVCKWFHIRCTLGMKA
jgi:TDG/mug DNA glycosylase family protein